MKRFELAFALFQVPLDYLALILAGLTAYSLRFSKLIVAIRPVIFNLPFNKYWPIVFVVAAAWVVIFAFAGLYSLDPNRKLARDFLRLLLACSTGFAGITIYVFFTLQKFDSRFLVLTSWVIAIVYVFLGRLLVRALKTLLFRLGVGLRRVVIIGSAAVTDTIINTFKHSPRLGYLVVGQFNNFSDRTAAELAALTPDEIIFTDPKAHEAETLAAVEYANDHHITFKYSADLFATIASNLSVSTIAGIPIVELRRTRLTGWGRIIKRLVDLIGSLILLIICSPIYLVVYIVILIETGRPIIYKNERVGQYGHKFFTLKFRSMFQKDSTGAQFGSSGEEALEREAELIKTNSVKAGPIYKIQNDPRVTPFGRFIRRWSLDETPQFWNVFIGEMSLVGPRPHQPREVDQYGKPHKIVLAIKPGITGLAQVSGRSDLDFADEMKLDAFYIEHWSLLTDLIILIKTPFVVLSKKGSVV
ncbi:MAG: sugar transferase [Candidatus Magasanikbacteria bacterium]|nr:sugar transferase [Candidatus Magasanikbacteria bacterium]